MFPIILDAGVSSAADAFSQFTSIVSTAWNFIWNNWYLAILLALPLGLFIVNSVMSMFRK